MSFRKRVYGFAVVKAINSNYNADFSHQPRTLPDGTVYATDKALKYTLKNYILDNYPDEKVFYFKRLNEDFNPYTLNEAYAAMFPNHVEKDKNQNVKVQAGKNEVAKDLLNCIDIKLFGATFALKGANNVALSVHGPVQINHGINILNENNIYSEQIMSPFRNPGEQRTEESQEGEERGQTSLGRQSKLQEGHYLHHFSVNPVNLDEVASLANADGVQKNDVEILKESMRKGATYFDSSAKAGTDNELLFWIELKENSKAVLPNFTDLVTMEKAEDGTVKFDLSQVNSILEDFNEDIEKCEIYQPKGHIKVENSPQNARLFDIYSGKPIQ